MKRFLWLAILLIFLSACTPASETAVSPQPSPETAVLPTATIPPPVIIEETVEIAEATAVPDPTQPTDPPTATPEPTAEARVESGVVSGRTAEGAFFFGDPNAPITHIDYSDFL